jgi:hypothetical protein
MKERRPPAPAADVRRCGSGGGDAASSAPGLSGCAVAIVDQ